MMHRQGFATFVSLRCLTSSWPSCTMLVKIWITTWRNTWSVVCLFDAVICWPVEGSARVGAVWTAGHKNWACFYWYVLLQPTSPWADFSPACRNVYLKNSIPYWRRVHSWWLHALFHRYLDSICILRRFGMGSVFISWINISPWPKWINACNIMQSTL